MQCCRKRGLLFLQPPAFLSCRKYHTMHRHLVRPFFSLMAVSESFGGVRCHALEGQIRCMGHVGREPLRGESCVDMNDSFAGSSPAESTPAFSKSMPAVGSRASFNESVPFGAPAGSSQSENGLPRASAQLVPTSLPSQACQFRTLAHGFTSPCQEAVIPIQKTHRGKAMLGSLIRCVLFLGKVRITSSAHGS